MTGPSANAADTNSDESDTNADTSGDPCDTEHATGQEQAAANAENEPAG